MSAELTEDIVGLVEVIVRTLIGNPEALEVLSSEQEVPYTLLQAILSGIPCFPHHQQG